MSCVKNETLMAYIDGELAGTEKEKIENHLASCDNCREALATLRGHIDLVVGNLEKLNPAFIPAQPAPDRQDSKKRFEIKARLLPPLKWRYALAASIFIFILGLLAGRWFLPAPGDKNPGTLQTNRQLHFVLQEYLEDLKPVIIEYANCEIKGGGNQGILLDKEFAAELVRRNTNLQKQLPTSKDDYLKGLLEELGLILEEISALTRDDPEALSLIQKLIRDREIIFKLESVETQPVDFTRI